ncbi:Membrane-fusion protein [Alteromonadaceae bacterium Bs31]|nr:Membrane-fusion protein [Alteromonadaceae bacterium Bs31]
MHALKPLLKHWLHMQCQMIHDCSLGLLVQSESEKSAKVLALWPESAATDNTAVQTARDVIEKRRMQMCKTQDGTVYLAYPIKIRDHFWGVLVIHLSRYDSTTMKAVIKLLDWGLTWLQFILFEYDTYIQRALEDSKAHSSLATVESNNSPTQELNLLSTALREKSLDESTIAIANFLASHFNLDRVSISLTKGNELPLYAVSFSANFDERTLPMQNIQNAMQEALTQKKDIHLSKNDKAENDNATILRNHQILLDSHQLKSCHSLVLTTEGNLVGVITIENAKVDNLNTATSTFIEKSKKPLASIFQLKKESQQSIRSILRRKLAKASERIFGTQHPIEKVFFACCAIFIVLLFIPGDFYVSNNATVESTNKHLLVSPYEGFLGAIHARPGDTVKQDQLLAKLKDEELNLERRKLSSQLQQYRLEYDNALANGNRAQAAILNAQVEQSKISLRLVEQKLERVHLKSPISGIIVSEDISQSLGAPVQQGDILFEIADSSAYQISLYVDERNIDFLKAQQTGLLNLKSLPGEKLEIRIERITPLSEVRNGRNYFQVFANLTATPDTLRPGMSGTAKIYINRRALGWIWFHDIWHWLRLALWI